MASTASTTPETRFHVDDLAPGRDDWKLEELLATDAFGELWRARHAFQPDDPPLAVRLVYRADLVSALKVQRHRLHMLTSVATHPGLAALRSVHFVADLVCLESECPEGKRLDQFIMQRGKKRSESWSREIALWVRQLTRPLGVLHRFLPPVVHRGLVAEKIVVQETESAEPCFKITDWFVAGIGPVAALNGETPEPRDDVYALGVLWHQMLTSKFGTKRPGGTQWRRKLAEQGATPAMLDLMEACFSEDAQRRPADSDAVARRLAELLEQATSAPAEPTPGGVPAESSTRPMPSIFDLLGTPSPALPSALLPEPAKERVSPPVSAETAESPKTARRRRGPTVRSLLDRLGQTAPELAKSVINAIGMKLLLIPPGSFQMGSPVDELGRRENEGPRHDVAIAKEFYVGIYPVTQREYDQVMSDNPSHFHCGAEGGAEHPVERVTWLQAIEFCRRLSELPEERDLGRLYSLPTEAEWEYSSRAGTNSPFSFGVRLSTRQANFDGAFPYGDAAKGPSLGRTSRVGSYASNNFGLCDMHGNVWEWCSDWYDASCYLPTPRKDPTGPKRGQLRVLRGGSWRNHAVTCRAAYRNALAPNLCDMYTGFRVVMRPTGRA